MQQILKEKYGSLIKIHKPSSFSQKSVTGIFENIIGEIGAFRRIDAPVHYFIIGTFLLNAFYHAVHIKSILRKCGCEAVFFNAASTAVIFQNI